MSTHSPGLLDTEPVAACMLSSSFSNPAGLVMPEAQKRELLALPR